MWNKCTLHFEWYITAPHGIDFPTSCLFDQVPGTIGRLALRAESISCLIWPIQPLKVAFWSIFCIYVGEYWQLLRTYLTGWCVLFAIYSYYPTTKTNNQSTIVISLNGSKNIDCLSLKHTEYPEMVDKKEITTMWLSPKVRPVVP